MSEGAYTILLVDSTSRAMRAERVLQDAGIASKLIPVPRQVRSDCGICIRVSRADRNAAIEALAAAGLETAGAHDV